MTDFVSTDPILTRRIGSDPIRLKEVGKRCVWIVVNVTLTKTNSHD
jgi:hypothetical protein